MGTWGVDLYQDDEAADIRDSVKSVLKIPVKGDRLLEILIEIHGSQDIKEDESQTFWLVVADQFEKNGILCNQVFNNALHIIESGENIARLSELGLEEKQKLKRENALKSLKERINNPRQAKEIKSTGKLPEIVVSVGEAYIFPTMRGMAMNAWFKSWSEAQFEPDGWGALLVIQTGRAYEWFPWCSIASLTVPPEKVPTLKSVESSRLIYHPQTEGAAICIPKKPHMKKMGMELLGTFNLNPEKAKACISKWSIQTALSCGWSICSASFSSNYQGKLPLGPEIRELLKNVG